MAARNTSAPKLVTLDRGFIILEEMNYARHASVQEALSLAQTQQALEPTRKFLVVQVRATIEPVLSHKITRHF